MVEKLYIGILVKRNGERSVVGVGTEDEVYELYEKLEDDLVEDGLARVEMVVRVATQAEVDRYRRELED